MNNIFPAEIIEYTSEYHFNKHNPKTLVIYQTLVAMMLVIGVSLFFIKVDISVNSLGIIRATNEDNQLRTIVSGKVEGIFVKENQPVEVGQTLLKIKADMLDEQTLLLNHQEDELTDRVADLKQLVQLIKKQHRSAQPILKSSLYSQQYIFFQQSVNQISNRLRIAEKNHDRYAFLYKKKVISAAEYEQAQFTYQEIKNELRLAYEEQGTQWQADLNALEMENDRLNAKLRQTAGQKDFYNIRAPISGIVKNLKGLQVGSTVVGNELIAEISANEGLLAEAYVLPKDIGFIKKGSKVNMQIDAFDYNQWGMIAGEVWSVSGDAYTDKKAPYFKVLIRLKQKALQLKNGYVGKLKKGMTLQARFFVTRRTLFQLLYDRVDDWLNPNVVAVDQTT